MKKTSLCLALATSVALSSTAAFAAPDTYMTFGASSLKYKEEAMGLKATANPYMGSVGIGANLYEHLAVEGMFAIGLNEADADISGISGVSGDLKLDYALGAYALVRSYENHVGSAFIKAGFTKMQGSGSVSSGGLSDRFDIDDSSFSYGLGVDFTYSPESSIRVEYMNYYDKDDITVDGFSLVFKTSLPL